MWRMSWEKRVGALVLEVINCVTYRLEGRLSLFSSFSEGEASMRITNGQNAPAKLGVRLWGREFTATASRIRPEPHSRVAN